MTKIRVKDGRYRGLDISEADRLALLEKTAFQRPPPRKCAKKGCNEMFVPRYRGHIYHSRKCNNAAAQQRWRARYKALVKALRKKIRDEKKKIREEAEAAS